MSKNYVKEFLMDPTFILGEISNVKLGRGKATLTNISTFEHR
jgi:hypothetical protein